MLVVLSALILMVRVNLKGNKMSTYNPDVWVVVKFSGEDVPDGEMYKILAGWYGGFTQGDSWKLNSGITKITQDEHNYHVDGYSGSTYVCHKEAERTSVYTKGIFDSFSQQYKTQGRRVAMEIVPIESIKDKFSLTVAAE
jgi:hypothetical protein